MASLVVNPDPTNTSDVANVAAIGLPPKAKYRLWHEDPKYGRLGVTNNNGRVSRNGTISTGIMLSAYVGEQTVGCETLGGTTWKLAATGKVMVQKAAVVVPGPEPTPPPTGSVWTAPANMTAAGFLDKIADLSVGTILLRPDHRLHTSGIEVGALPIHVDRSVKPLLIQPIDGTSTFHGVTGAAYYDGVFDWQARGITMNDVAFGDYWLAQAGIHSINGSTGLRFARHGFLPTITRHPHATKPIFPWAVYQGRGHNEDIVYDSFDVQGTGISGIQIDCESCATGGHPATAKDITVRNLTGKDLAYLFYENVATDGLTLDGATGINCGWNGVAVAFHQARGTYRGVSVAPSVVARNGSGMVAVA